MRLPEIRDRMHELAEEHGIGELHELAEETRRRRRQPPAPVVSATVTPELADAVRAYCVAFPDLSMHEVGRLFGLNQGRISEILHGRRT